MFGNFKLAHFPFDPVNMAQFNGLFQASWKDQAGQVLGGLQLDELLNWRYGRNPYGRARQFVATHQDQWVGHVGIEPQRVKVGDREILAFQAGQVLVAEAFQGKWIFSQLVRQLHTHLAEQGEYFVFGFPNRAAFPVWRRNGWKDLLNVPTLVFPLRWDVLLSLKMPALNFLKYPLDMVSAGIRAVARRRPPEGCRIEPLSHIEAEFDKLWEEAKGQFLVAAVRDAAYLRWRYFCAPKSKQYLILACWDNSQRLIGYAALLKETVLNIPALIIMDLLAAPGTNALPGLISAAVDYGLAKGVSLVMTIMPKHSSYYRSLLWAGFIPVPERFLVKSMILSGSMEFFDQSAALIANPASWHITFGDWDGL